MPSTKTLATLLAAFLIFNLLGCAAIFSGKEQKIQVNSMPAKAEVLIGNESMGTTPTTLTLTRSEEHRLELKLPGYKPASVVLKNSTNPVVFGNIAGCIFGFGIVGIIGFVVDFTTGAAYKLSPEQVIGQLEREGTALEDIDPETVHIFLTLDPKPEWELVGYLQPEGSSHTQPLVLEFAR